MDEVFVGHMGNWLTIEPLLATGTVEVAENIEAHIIAKRKHLGLS